jgi:hypothetical protein
MNCLLDLATCLQASEGGQAFAICVGFVVIGFALWGLHAFLSHTEGTPGAQPPSHNHRTAARLTPYDRHQPVYQPPRPPSPPPPKPQPTRTSRASGRNKPTIVTNGSPKRRPIPRQEPLPPVEWGPWRNN